MQPDQLAFLEEMISNAKVLSIVGAVRELKMRYTECLACRSWLQSE